MKTYQLETSASRPLPETLADGHADFERMNYALRAVRAQGYKVQFSDRGLVSGPLHRNGFLQTDMPLGTDAMSLLAVFDFEVREVEIKD